MSSTRSTRRTAATPDASTLSYLESLLLAQAVWELGAAPSTWAPIAKLLSKHPLLSRPKSFFTAQSCRTLYVNLMKIARLEWTEDTIPVQAPLSEELARKFFQLRWDELHHLISLEEVKFKTIAGEIEELRAGHWDDKIKSIVSESPIEARQRVESPPASISLPRAPPSKSPQNLVDDAQVDEAFEGSDLSGVTDSGSSSCLQEDTTTASNVVLVSSEELDTIKVGLQERLQDESVATLQTTDIPNPELPEMLPPQNSSEPSLQPEGNFSDDMDEEDGSHVERVAIEDAAAKQPDGIWEDTSFISPKGMDMDKNGQDDLMDLTQDEDVSSPHHSPGSIPAEEMFEDHNPEPYQSIGEEVEAESDLMNTDEVEREGINSTQNEENDQTLGENSASEVETDHQPDLDSTQHDINGQATFEAAETSLEDAEVEVEPIQISEVTKTVVEDVEVKETAEDEGNSSGDEPLHVARRSTRRRKSSAASTLPALKTRGRARRPRPVSESDPSPAPMEVDMDGDSEIKPETPQGEEEQVSSPLPVDSTSGRRRDGKRKASLLEGIDLSREKKRARDDSEPVEEEEPGSSSNSTRPRTSRHGTRTEEQVALKRFQNVIGMLHSQISQHRNGNIFHNPIKNSEAPDYHDIVKRPMDLKTIKARVKDGLVANSLEYQRDICLMFANALMYNRPGSDVHTMAEDMMLESERYIITFRQTEGFVRGTLRP